MLPSYKRRQSAAGHLTTTSRFHHHHLSYTGWSRHVLVEAFVVNIKHAAAADEDGLVNPLLDRYNAGGCHYSVFGLPAVQVSLRL